MRLLTVRVVLVACIFGALSASQAVARGKHNIKTVFIILMENHNWTGTQNATSIEGSRYAPYINNTLLPMASHAEQYFQSTGHPSQPAELPLA